MQTRRSFATAACLLLASPAGAAPPAPRPIHRVTEVSVYSLPGPHMIRVCARGFVTSGGWTSVPLVPVHYVQAPPDGMWDFIFKATPPADPPAQPAAAPIKASRVWYPAPQHVTGVRVKGANNSVSARLNQGPSVC